MNDTLSHVTVSIVKTSKLSKEKQNELKKDELLRYKEENMILIVLFTALYPNRYTLIKPPKTPVDGIHFYDIEWDNMENEIEGYNKKDSGKKKRAMRIKYMINKIRECKFDEIGNSIVIEYKTRCNVSDTTIPNIENIILPNGINIRRGEFHDIMIEISKIIEGFEWNKLRANIISEWMTEMYNWIMTYENNTVCRNSLNRNNSVNEVQYTLMNPEEYALPTYLVQYVLTGTGEYVPMYYPITCNIMNIPCTEVNSMEYEQPSLLECNPINVNEYEKMEGFYKT